MIRYHAWIYPGAPAQNAPLTYRSNRIHVLRVQYFTVQNDGSLKFLLQDDDDLDDTENGFSAANLADLKAHCDEVLVTVSCSIAAFRAVYASGDRMQRFLATLITFCSEWDVTGIDLDLEGYAQWSQCDYGEYKRLVFELGWGLRRCGRKLAICCPTDYTPENQAYAFRYEDIRDLPVDYITAMCYDYHYLDELGAPIAPLKWIHEWSCYLLSLCVPERIVIGLPSYSYRLDKRGHAVENITLEQAKKAGVYRPEYRDQSSGEVIVDEEATTWVICDALSLTQKVQTAQHAGATQVSVWHLGGNDWLA
ncbi:hypothetical protein HDU85_003899 [Gaertneriomyces sp. JEL0708]|nr:hypothetical protein HDU85_003899 [Gaertneriomyces sp. JEL0708]